MHGKERTYFLVLLLGGATALTFLVFRPFLNTVALAAVCAVLLHPLRLKIEKTITKSRALSSFIALIIGVLIILIPLALVSVLVVEEASNAYTALATGSTGLTIQEVAVSVGTWLEPRFPGSYDFFASISGEIQNYIAQVLHWFVLNAGAALSSVVATGLRTLIFLMTLYYFLKDGDELRDLLTKRSPITESEVGSILDHLSRTIFGIIKGSLMIAVIQGILSGIGYFIFGLPNPTLWGVTTAVSALIPGVGTSLVFIPAITFLFATGHVASAIGLLLWAIILVGMIDNILSPKLISQGAGLHPLLILLSVIGGLAFYGPVGIFMGPLTVSLLFSIYLTYSNAKITEA